MTDMVVLIDDDGVTNFVNQKMIERHFPDLEIRVFSSAYAAIEILKKETPSTETTVILLDIVMPQISAWDFLEILKQEFGHQNYCVHLVTSSIWQGHKERSQQFEMVRSFISKPLTGSEVKKIILGKE